jgi:histidinol phosphatase-like PHP family hydrolase
MTETNTSAALTDTICNRLTYYITNGQLSNDDLVQIIEHTGSYLNLATRSEWKRQTGKCYNTAKKYRRNVRLFGATFVIDND